MDLLNDVANVLYAVLMIVVTLGLLIGVHEYGHFWVARRCGVHVERFSIGFGPALLRWRDRRGTEYVLAPIMLGGYVKMLGGGADYGGPASKPDHPRGMGDVPAGKEEQAFSHKPVLQRMAVVAAGPAANLLLAALVFWGLLFIRGEEGIVPVVGVVLPDSHAAAAGVQEGDEIVAVDGRATPTWRHVRQGLVERIGDTGPLRLEMRPFGSDHTRHGEARLQRWLADADAADLFLPEELGVGPWLPPIPPVLDHVQPDGPAAAAGLVAGDRILSADGRAVTDWREWVRQVRASPGHGMTLEVERDGARLERVLTLATRVDDGGGEYGYAGASAQRPPLPPELVREFRYGPLEALWAGARRTGDLMALMLESVIKMLSGLMSPKNLSGPVTIAEFAAESSRAGLPSYLMFVALLSVSLGVLNLLPIPVLDGGHLLYFTMELVARRPVPPAWQAVGHGLGMAIVVGVMALALYNDIARL